MCANFLPDGDDDDDDDDDDNDPGMIDVDLRVWPRVFVAFWYWLVSLGLRLRFYSQM